jgi:hypothetical protein
VVTIENTGNVTDEDDAYEYVMKNDKGEVLCTGWREKTAEDKAAELPGNENKSDLK